MRCSRDFDKCLRIFSDFFKAWNREEIRLGYKGPSFVCLKVQGGDKTKSNELLESDDFLKNLALFWMTEPPIDNSVKNRSSKSIEISIYVDTKMAKLTTSNTVKNKSSTSIEILTRTLNGAEGTVPPGRVYKKVAIVENFFDIIHAVHVDLEGRPGKHAGQKRTYRTITETYAFLPREAVTRFLLGCTECQRRPRTPSPTNLSNQSQSTSAATLTTTTTLTSTATPLSPNTAGAATLTTTSTTSVQSSPKLREGNHGGDGKPLYSYRHQKHQKGNNAGSSVVVDKTDKEKEEKYNPLSITNLLKKEPVTGGFLPSADTSLPESRRTPESDRASSRSSASSKRKRMLPEGRTPSPQPSQPLPRPWSPGLDPKNTPIDYSLPITTSYLKHQQRLLQAEKKAAAMKESELEQKMTVLPSDEIENVERDRYSPATGLIDTNLNLLATIQHLHCQVMLALTERLRPSMTIPSPLVLPSMTNVLSNGIMMGSEVSVQTGENHT
ncbi:Nucleolar protein 4 [Habropoda laboriosa]|uniref:Nucleolar protein 4 n=1 Tax=Habropoda laboriosa TaxID=597456 RepID=A0A0L7R2C7_9HYME|nr:Nucleolar protein 4 [Habropoda laboriosa]